MIVLRAETWPDERAFSYRIISTSLSPFNLALAGAAAAISLSLDERPSHNPN